MKRTLTDARNVFEEQIPSLTDYWVDVGKRILSQAEDEATKSANEYVAEQEAEALAMRDDALKELTSVRDELDELASQASAGRVSAAEGSARLDKLGLRQAEAEGELNQIEQLAEQMAGIEAEPIEWYSDLQQRMPHLLMDSPW